MLEQVHKHVVAELQQSARTDTVFVITAVAFDLIVLGINWTVASSAHSPYNRSVAAVWIFPLLLLATCIVNVLTVRGLFAGKDTRAKLLSGIILMYSDTDVQKYYDPSLIDLYTSRYKLFAAVVTCLGAVAIVIPTLEFILGS